MTVFTIPTTLGTAHVRCYTRAERPIQSLLDAFSVPSTHYVPKIIFIFSPICCASTNSNAICSIIMKDLIIFPASATSNLPFLLVGCDSKAGDCAMT